MKIMDLTKRKAIRSKAITRAAKGEACTWPGCHRNTGTTTFAHSNMSIHGKAGSRKADDIYGAFLCGAHHDYYDNEPENEIGNKEWSFMRAMSATWRRLYELGIITIKGAE